MLITARSSTTTQRLYCLKFTLVNRSHSQNAVVAVHCLGCHFLILYACAHEVSFPDQRPRSLVWKRDQYTSEIASGQCSTHGWHSRGIGQRLNTTQVRRYIQLPTFSYTKTSLLTALVNCVTVVSMISFCAAASSCHVIDKCIMKLVSQSLVRRAVGPSSGSSWLYYT